ncbi:MAG: four helix bundle protein [bacterium]
MTTQTLNSKQYDPETRTLKFAKKTREYISKLPKTISNIEDSKQLTRSSGSVGANYIEANESLSKKDLIMRIKISRKECKETRFWLNLIVPSPEETPVRIWLLNESLEILKILSSILNKSV